MVDVFDHRFEPETCTMVSRRELRETTEELEFDEERYMGDEYMGVEEDMLYLAAKEYVPFWEEGGSFNEQNIPTEEDSTEDTPSSSSSKPLQAEEQDPPSTSTFIVTNQETTTTTTTTTTTSDSSFQWTEAEMQLLQKLPNKEYLLDAHEEKAALAGLVSIFIGYQKK
jgi:hypothetical protein